MSLIALLPALILAALAGVCLLAAFLWHRLVPSVGDETRGANARSNSVLRYGGATGLTVFGGFLLVSGLYAAAVATGATAATGGIAATLRAVAVGLVVVAFATFLGTAAGALRTRRDAVR